VQSRRRGQDEVKVEILRFFLKEELGGINSFSGLCSKR